MDRNIMVLVQNRMDKLQFMYKIEPQDQKTFLSTAEVIITQKQQRNISAT